MNPSTNFSSIFVIVMLSLFLLLTLGVVIIIIKQTRRKNRIMANAEKIASMQIKLGDRASKSSIPFSISSNDKYLIFENKFNSKIRESIFGFQNFASVISNMSRASIDLAMKLQLVQNKGDYKTSIDFTGEDYLPYIKVIIKNKETGKEIYRYFPSSSSYSGFDEIRFRTGMSRGFRNASSSKMVSTYADQANIWNISGVLDTGEYELTLETGNFNLKEIGTVTFDELQMEFGLMKAPDETKVLVKK